MNITFLMGNGFDIGLGLKTRYADFYEEYCKSKDTDTRNIQDFKKILKEWNSDKEKAVTDWADFEKAFGEHSGNFQGLEDKWNYIERFEDFVQDFNLYLENEEKNADFADTSKIADVMRNGINTYFHIREGDKIEIQRLYNQNSSERIYNFISFNYTRTVDVCAKILNDSFKKDKNGKLGSVVHVHGFIDEYMIMGVNDSSQIKNPEFAKDTDIIMEIVKPQQNADSRTTYDTKATNIINSSDIICVYGMSIGATDKKWWETIAKWLANGDKHRLIILGHEDKYNKRFTFAQRQFVVPLINRFLAFSNLSETSKQVISNRIYVDINHDVFGMNLRKVSFENNKTNQSSEVLLAGPENVIDDIPKLEYDDLFFAINT